MLDLPAPEHKVVVSRLLGEAATLLVQANSVATITLVDGTTIHGRIVSSSFVNDDLHLVIE